MAHAPNRLAGMATLTVDGQRYMLVGDFEYTPSRVTRETLVGMDTVHGYKETPKAGHIAATIRNAYGLDVAALNAMENVTIVVELNNGKTVTARNMWAIEDQTVKQADATIDIKWEGTVGAVTEE